MENAQKEFDRRTILKLLGTAGTAAMASNGVGYAAGLRSAASVEATAQSDIEPFEIHVSDAELDSLHDRLADIRWPPNSPGEPWAYGTDRS